MEGRRIRWLSADVTVLQCGSVEVGEIVRCELIKNVLAGFQIIMCLADGGEQIIFAKTNLWRSAWLARLLCEKYDLPVAGNIPLPETDAIEKMPKLPWKLKKHWPWENPEKRKNWPECERRPGGGESGFAAAVKFAAEPSPSFARTYFANSLVADRPSPVTQGLEAFALVERKGRKFGVEHFGVLLTAYFLFVINDAIVGPWDEECATCPVPKLFFYTRMGAWLMLLATVLMVAVWIYAKRELCFYSDRLVLRWLFFGLPIWRTKVRNEAIMGIVLFRGIGNMDWRLGLRLRKGDSLSVFNTWDRWGTEWLATLLSIWSGTPIVERDFQIPSRAWPVSRA